MATITYEGYNIEAADDAVEAFAAASGIAVGGLAGVLRRGMRVVLSNEAMSKANAAVTKLLRDGGEKAKGADFTKVITTWREDDANKDAYAALLDTARGELWAKVVDGTLGMGRDGDGMTAEERMRFEVAAALMTALYVDLNAKNKKEGKPEMAPFLTMGAYRAQLQAAGDASAFAEMFEPGKRGNTFTATEAAKEYVAAKKHEKVQAFLTKVQTEGDSLHKHNRRFERMLAEAKAAAEATKAEGKATIAEGSLDDL